MYHNNARKMLIIGKAVCRGDGGIWELTVLSRQSSCKYKSALK